MKEFYIGYLPKAPDGIRRLIRLTVISLVAMGIVGALLFARVQPAFAPSAFEFQTPREFHGVIETTPYPALRVPRPSKTDANADFSRYLLVDPGKHGADVEVAAFSGKTASLKGKLIYREQQTMIELVPGSIVVSATSQPAERSMQTLGEVTLAGEIVDSKCYSGVMNPGTGKVHRDCAVRCISGGIPPALVTTGLGPNPVVVLLTDPAGKPFPKERLFDVIARPVSIHGELRKSGDTYYLATEAGSIAPAP